MESSKADFVLESFDQKLGSQTPPPAGWVKIQNDIDIEGLKSSYAYVLASPWSYFEWISNLEIDRISAI